MNTITEVDASIYLERIRIWKEKLSALQDAIDRRCSYPEVAEIARRLKKEFTAEVAKAKTQCRKASSPIIEHYYSRIQDINFKFSAVVDAQPFTKLSRSISNTEWEIDWYEGEIESWLNKSLLVLQSSGST